MALEKAPVSEAPLAFDIGMYDGRDTAYYLRMGYRVVGVEANPELADRARRRFAREIESGRVSVENVAIAEEQGRLSLFLCGEDLGSSSLIRNWAESRGAAAEIVVDAVPLGALFDRYGIPHYMKVDIEGADRQCILPLTADRRPPFLSFELGPDGEELIRHLGGIGYRRFKIISQNSFRELENRDLLSTRVARRMRGTLHLPPQRRFLRGGHLFRRSFSSGPMPEFSDGRWRGLAETLERWHAEARVQRPDSWWDLHAAVAEPIRTTRTRPRRSEATAP
jgi:FkbM family methyltransferase